MEANQDSVRIIKDSVSTLRRVYNQLPDLVEVAIPCLVRLTMIALTAHMSEEAIKVVGAFSFSSNEQVIDAIFQNNFLGAADELLSKPRKDVNKSEVLWALSNLTASQQRHIEAIMTHEVW